VKNASALIIMAKAPIGEHVKTRLKGYLDDDETTVAKLRDVPGVDTHMTYWPVDAGEYFSRFGLPAFPQEGAGIGMKMHAALEKVLSEGYQKAALVGVDIPGLKAEVVLKAIGLLADHDVVFGPTEDGGYYLVGLKAPEKGLFEDIEWSAETTLSRSLERAGELGLSAALADTLYDIDTARDLERFRGQDR
jgi:rSAM/selenodomain-associated transferase 1